MRVVLVGPASRRPRVLRELSGEVTVVGEASTLSAGRAAASAANAYVLLIPAAKDEDRLIEPLTPRETQVLELVADGLPNKAIARLLGVSDETVKFHLASVFGKLGASNRTDAVRLALRDGLITI
ncbi:MAG TPA: response regulator transcription factor [Vicinamibacterales bacterium]|nr:response regulator transcription factor [Vicinamibacterales bacterium]